MFCGFLVLTIISLSVKCKECCSRYQCGLIDNETLCSSKSNCKWSSGKCVGYDCGDISQPSCAGPHNTGDYTDTFYCKWSDSACVVGTNVCADYNNDKDVCLETGKCKYDGTNCISASSCNDFSDTTYIGDCQYVRFNGTSCVKDGNTCKPWACADFEETACNQNSRCYYTGGACAPITSCSVLNSTKCFGSYDSNGNICNLKDNTCKIWECGDLDQTSCYVTMGQCSWRNSTCVEDSADPCSIFSESTCSFGCNLLTSCPVEPSSSGLIIYMPALLVALVLMFLL